MRLLPAMNIKIRSFRAEIPRYSKELIPSTNAQRARNCRLMSGKLEAWRKTLRVHRPSKPGTKRSIYLWGAKPGGDAEGTITAVENTTPVRLLIPNHGRTTGERLFIDGTGLAIDGATYTITVVDQNIVSLDGTVAAGASDKGSWVKQNGFWFAWTTDVDVVRAPIVGDVTERTYFTGDGVPKVTDSSIATGGGGTQYPTNAFTLGVPAPESPVGNLTRVPRTGAIAAITKAKPIHVRTETEHGLQTGDQVTFADVGGMTELNGAKFTITVIDGDEFTLDDSDGTSYGDYTGGGTWTEVYTDEDVSTRAYVYTYVTAWGEESAPSPPSATIDAGPDEKVKLEGMLTGPAGNFNVNRKRIYRATTTAVGTVWLFVDEIPVAQTDYIDAKTEGELGQQLQTEAWDMPPPDMFGIVALANGVVVGLSGNQVCPSVPYQPHAYPVEWRQGTDAPCVALGVFHTTAVVLTEGHPYLLVGTEPSTMTLVKVENHQSCVSKRGVRSLHQYGVVYPSPDGLVRIGPEGSWEVVTAPFMTRKEWQALNPSSIHAYVVDGKYLAFYDNGTEQGAFLFDPADPQTGLVFFDLYATAGFMDLRTDSLYLQIGDYIERFDSGAELLSYLWRSKLFRFGRRRFSCARVIADDYNDVTLRVYADGKLRHTEEVEGPQSFRLSDPDDDGAANEWEIELAGTSAVRAVGIAETASELSDL